MIRHDLGCAIADEGSWEEFHQKRKNFFMYDWHKARRLKLETEYRKEDHLKIPVANHIKSS